MRAEDAVAAAGFGASHIGVIFAGGPRQVSARQAKTILAGVPKGVRKVGVFGAQAPDAIARVVEESGVDVVQLHALEPEGLEERVSDVRAFTGRPVWVVLRLDGATLPAHASRAARAGDAVLLDKLVAGQLGGAGVTLDWPAIADDVRALTLSTGKRLVLAGGLRPANVRTAIRAIHPDIVDVSSGVERSPGIKDHDRMRAFMDAASREA